jgi:hypothetical protein
MKNNHKSKLKFKNLDGWCKYHCVENRWRSWIDWTSLILRLAWRIVENLLVYLLKIFKLLNFKYFIFIIIQYIVLLFKCVFFYINELLITHIHQMFAPKKEKVIKLIHSPSMHFNFFSNLHHESPMQPLKITIGSHELT